MKRRKPDPPPVVPDRSRVRALIGELAAAKLAGDTTAGSSHPVRRELFDLAGIGAYVLSWYEGDRPLSPDELERATDWAIAPRGAPWPTFGPPPPVATGPGRG